MIDTLELLATCTLMLIGLIICGFIVLYAWHVVKDMVDEMIELRNELRYEELRQERICRHIRQHMEKVINDDANNT